MPYDGLYPDDLRAAITLIDWLNEGHSFNTDEAKKKLAKDNTLWTYAGKIQIVNPEHGQPIGWAVWHGDGFWYFEPKEKK